MTEITGGKPQTPNYKIQRNFKHQPSIKARLGEFVEKESGFELEPSAIRPS